jgi:hypothetical protein
MTVLRNEVLPFFFLFLLLIASAIAVDFGLHLAHFVWVGRYLGIVGLALILGWLLPNALRKRKVTTYGSPATLLRLHQATGFLGALLIIVHAGIHFNALLPWLALVAMLVNVGSGLTGVFLFQRARRGLEVRRAFLLAEGRSLSSVEQELFWDSIAVEMLKKWRIVHLPITLAFGLLTSAHVVSVLMFWGWR